MIRTRFAPSPTGYLHVGGARTALYSWLFARHHGGQFVLRIEDTDQVRSTPESVQAILDGMTWLGLNWDKGPIFQSDRYLRYQAVVEQLLQSKQAYRCTCSKERLEALRAQQLEAKEKPRYDGRCRDLNLPESSEPFVVRFKNPQEGTVHFQDEVYGDIQVANAELDDLVIVRSDGHPTYNFAVVIDDWDMQITHVIRGDDHINNTPRQINLFQALGAPVPVFAHLPMILGEDGKRLSKRHGAVSVMQFHEAGYLPHALLNYLVRLGWSSGDQEIFSVEDMIAKFDLKHISRGGASFNYDKLQWLNQHYLKQDSAEAVANELAGHFAKQSIDITQGPPLTAIVPIFAERCKTLAEMCEKSRFFYDENVTYDEEAVNKHLRPALPDLLTAFASQLALVPDWNMAAIHQEIQTFCQTQGIGMGKIAQPLRVAVTGTANSPSIDMTLALLGKEKTLARIEAALKAFI